MCIFANLGDPKGTYMHHLPKVTPKWPQSEPYNQSRPSHFARGENPRRGGEAKPRQLLGIGL